MRLLSVFLNLSLILCVPSLSAEAWVRGSAVVADASGQVEVKVPGEGVVYDSFEEPRYISGIFSSHAQSGASALIHTSNGMTLAFRGAGHFSVERFEGVFGADAAEDEERLAQTRSRMILNLRRGELLIDSRSLTADSRFVVETPFGRIASVKAVLLIRIEFDYRSDIYDFTISCAEGSVRLSDMRGQAFSIYAGQRISGAGSYMAPAIEVGNQTDQIREKFELFFRTLAEMDLEGLDRRKLRAHTEALPDLEDTTTTAFRLSGERSALGEKRPRVIEFAPKAKTISPFRGEIKPPSDSQADIF